VLRVVELLVDELPRGINGKPRDRRFELRQGLLLLALDLVLGSREDVLGLRVGVGDDLVTHRLAFLERLGDLGAHLLFDVRQVLLVLGPEFLGGVPLRLGILVAALDLVPPRFQYARDRLEQEQLEHHEQQDEPADLNDQNLGVYVENIHPINSGAGSRVVEFPSPRVWRLANPRNPPTRQPANPATCPPLP
jgi:hypothetical protein